MRVRVITLIDQEMAVSAGQWKVFVFLSVTIERSCGYEHGPNGKSPYLRGTGHPTGVADLIWMNPTEPPSNPIIRGKQPSDLQVTRLDRALRTLAGISPACSAD